MQCSVVNIKTVIAVVYYIISCLQTARNCHIFLAADLHLVLNYSHKIAQLLS